MPKKEKKPKKPAPPKKQIDFFKMLDNRVLDDTGSIEYGFANDYGDKLTRIYPEQQAFRYKHYYRLEELFKGHNPTYHCKSVKTKELAKGDRWVVLFRNDANETITRYTDIKPIGYLEGDFELEEILPKNEDTISQTQLSDFNEEKEEYEEFEEESYE